MTTDQPDDIHDSREWAYQQIRDIASTLGSITERVQRLERGSASDDEMRDVSGFLDQFQEELGRMTSQANALGQTLQVTRTRLGEIPAGRSSDVSSGIQTFEGEARAIENWFVGRIAFLSSWRRPTDYSGEDDPVVRAVSEFLDGLQPQMDRISVEAQRLKEMAQETKKRIAEGEVGC